MNSFLTLDDGTKHRQSEKSKTCDVVLYNSYMQATLIELPS